MMYVFHYDMYIQLVSQGIHKRYKGVYPQLRELLPSYIFACTSFTCVTPRICKTILYRMTGSVQLYVLTTITTNDLLLICSLLYMYSYFINVIMYNVQGLCYLDIVTPYLTINLMALVKSLLILIIVVHCMVDPGTEVSLVWGTLRLTKMIQW